VNPDLAIGYVDSCTNFWMTAYDSVNGGFSANVDRAGQLLASWGTNENLVSQTRNAYGFVRGFMMTGNESSR